MAHEIKIVALPTATRSMHGTGLARTRTVYAANAGARGWELIPRFSSLSVLWNEIRARCIGPPVHCLKELEIGAHGSPDSIDGVFDDIVGGNDDVFGALMRQHKNILCDRVHVYCSGCNTGIDFGPWDSIAENIADQIPFDNDTFPHRVTVYGTKGYKMQGTSHMMGNEDVRATVTYRGVTYPSHWNAENARGNDAWNSFNNW